MLPLCIPFYLAFHLLTSTNTCLKSALETCNFQPCQCSRHIQQPIFQHVFRSLSSVNTNHLARPDTHTHTTTHTNTFHVTLTDAFSQEVPAHVAHTHAVRVSSD